MNLTDYRLIPPPVGIPVGGPFLTTLSLSHALAPCAVIQSLPPHSCSGRDQDEPPRGRPASLQPDALGELPPALRGIGNTSGWLDYSKVMASALLTLLPPLIVSFTFQRNLVKGIASTGMKG